MTWPVTEVAALGMYDRSAAHEASQRTCARLDAVRRMVDESASRWEGDQLDKTQTDLDACAADIEDIHSRSVNLVRTLQEDAAKAAVHVGGLAPEVEDRIGSNYDMIRARFESAQRLALTATSTLEEEIFTCQGEKADAVDREVKTDENMRKLNEDLSDCANYADGSHKAWVSCTEGLTSVDRVSLDTYFSVEEITLQVGVFVPRRAASDLEASNIFSVANRADRVEETQQGVLDRLRSQFEDMQEMSAAVVSNMCSCTGQAGGGVTWRKS
ncbi:expressed unknown protein [Ectocarpus siliculosus]|uniref:Uncharacterized protein n=1 Tax=Ectocarpus siliculosus TaxID=2880 RepID=D7FKZ4_ECTSI|nr:expressed unknown protein [Ectocarpus siliculosus]|eukprot:CBJ29537.1 expressed unknown protein [Ectocarpus siliculosus]